MSVHITYYTAKWCGPCRSFGPSLEVGAQQLNIPLTKIDIDEAPVDAQAHGIMSVPTVIVTTDAGEVIDRFGALPPAQLRTRLRDIAST